MPPKAKSSVSWFVDPELVQLDLGDGLWVQVKRELTVGESMAIQQALIKSVRADGRVEPDLSQVWKANICAYLVDWNLERHGKRVPYSLDAVDNLSKQAWDRISSAVTAHIDEMDAQRGKLIGSTSRPDSPSADA
jgi:hypothetical protein